MNSYAQAQGKIAEPEGATFDRNLDGARLAGQQRAVFELMKDGRWRTLQRIATVIGKSEAGISARLRDLRKPQFGAYQVDKRRVAGGLWEYRLIMPEA